MQVQASQYQLQNVGTVLKIRCPICHQRATFESIVPQDVYLPQTGYVAGQRRCPDPSCASVVFFVYQVSGVPKLIVSYPAEKIDFDATNIPATVLKALEEAVTCHAANCFVAAAIMVRKTLEELCAERGAQGDSLKARIKALGNKVVLPADLLNGLDDLRLLGNDAAHIESQEYNSIGKEEVEVGLELAKEVLKAVYQYAALLQRLRALKRP